MTTSDNLSLTRAEWLKKAAEALAKSGIGTARLDCLVLLEDLLGKDRTHLLAYPELKLTTEQISELDSLIRRRTKHESLAYIRGKTEFYGREFIINKHVLEPRPESETMIDLLIKVLGDRLEVTEEPVTIVDVGTGSGALAITTKLEYPKAKVIATEIDPNCLKIAKQNAAKYKASIKFLQGNLLESAYDLEPSTANLVLANLPYVPDNFTVNQAAAMEPKIAIFGGEDGLDVYRRLFDQLKTRPAKFVLTESLPFQHKNLATIAKRAGYKLQIADDFIQVFKLGL